MSYCILAFQEQAAAWKPVQEAFGSHLSPVMIAANKHCKKRRVEMKRNGSSSSWQACSSFY